MEDDEHSGHQKSDRSPKQIRKNIDILIKDRCVSARLIESMTGISKCIFRWILTEDLKKGEFRCKVTLPCPLHTHILCMMSNSAKLARF